MKSRNIGVALVVLVSSLFLLAGTASANGTGSDPETCIVHSLPSFVAQGEGVTAATVGDVIEVECDPTIYGTKSKVKITASQLFSRCESKLKWYVPNNPPGPEETEKGGFEKFENERGVSVRLDADGNATVVVLAGPNCSAGENLVTAHMEEEPYESFTTSFTVLAPVPTTPGVYALPANQVEDSYSSAAATIVEAEFANGSEKYVRIGSEELYQRCRNKPHIHWIRMDGTEPESVETPEITKVQLDNDGNAFVIAIGDSSCAPGASLIEADLESKPFTTFMTDFTIEAPRPTI